MGTEPAKRGRPSGLTPEIRELICQSIREGNFREVAAKWVGVPLRTFWDWCSKGKCDTEGPYFELMQAIQEAECAAEMKMVEQVYKAATQDPKHAQWWLERKVPQRWGPNRHELAQLRQRLNEIEKAHAAPAPKPVEEGREVPADVPHVTGLDPDE